MKKAFLLFFILFSLVSFAQRINGYEFVMVPTKFDFQRTENEYRLNTLLKFRLEEYGFKAYYTTDPSNKNYKERCMYLTAIVVNESNVFLTRLHILFKDCNNAVVYQSVTGTSKEKNRNNAFNEALAGALVSVKGLNYEFNGVKSDHIPVADDVLKERNEDLEAKYNALVAENKALMAKNEALLALRNQDLAEAKARSLEAQNNVPSKIETVATKEIPATKIDIPTPQVEVPEVKAAPQVVETEILPTKKTAVATKKKVPASAVKKYAVKGKPITMKKKQVAVAKAKTPVDEKVAVVEKETKIVSTETPVKTIEPIVEKTEIATEQKQEVAAEEVDLLVKKNEVLFAQPTENGFKLIDSTPKVVLEIIKTMQPDYYNANVDKKFGVLYKKNNQWVFEYFTNGNLNIEILNIKF